MAMWPRAGHISMETIAAPAVSGKHNDTHRKDTSDNEDDDDAGGRPPEPFRIIGPFAVRRFGSRTEGHRRWRYRPPEKVYPRPRPDARRQQQQQQQQRRRGSRAHRTMQMSSRPNGEITAATLTTMAMYLQDVPWRRF
ncbi:uncharacterized protein LOC111271720 isoform X2 [Varroa jacobsoni]|uniref:uncharacterized protein LOC111271720 isoform X2 n=1 Tax=Varroa jacobsoni TaxID=62625 RepID=UPI000BFA08E0|nr:uncharacterized protein LOC111271720 isoform X2 [Varroa jacobsoni]